MVHAPVDALKSLYDQRMKRYAAAAATAVAAVIIAGGTVLLTPPQEAEIGRVGASIGVSTGPSQAPDLNCDDFDYQEDAQAFFEANGPGDPHGLDNGGVPGLACELLDKRGADVPPSDEAVEVTTPDPGQRIPGREKDQ